MADFPREPISPREFMEDFVPRALADGPLASSSGDDAVQLGVKLEGDGGGEWVIHLSQGNLKVEATSRESAAFTILQSVDDWRGALWEGRGGVFGQQASAMFSGAGAGEGGGMTPGTAPNAAAIGQLAGLDGLIQIVVTGGEGGDWCTGFKLGPGAIPEQPTTQLKIAAEDAEDMASGALDPMSAFMSGKIQVIGDMGLMMQMQAITMQAAAQPPKAD
ncbi:MAG: SCP2 sterol-binding domain-containing protein [Deltaproteobacteria bacterium]|nr:SCP2 sterol-binding domain-containing protein [Deltaproteobacteria bacterium]